jgi:hypothetical protein
MKTKIGIVLIILLATNFWANAQVTISTDGSSATSSTALFEVKSTSQGVLIPRMTSAQRTAISSPANGLMVFDTDSATFWFYNSSHWHQLLSGGTETNRIRIEADGSMFAEGTATMWDDLTISLATATKNAGSQPTLTQVGASSIYLYAFTEATNELFFTVQMPHSWKIGSNIYPHIHWFPSTALSGTAVLWQLDYSWANLNSAFNTTVTTISGTATVAGGSGAAYEHKLTPFLDGSSNSYIDGSSHTLSSILICRLYRTGGAAADTYTGTAFALQLDFHYEKDTQGSRSEYTK